MRMRWGKSWRLNPRRNEPQNASSLKDPSQQPDRTPASDAPLIVIDHVKNALRIAALPDDDRLSGIFVGQSLGDARTIHPEIETVQHAPHEDDALLRQIAQWCARYTPLVAIHHLAGDHSLFLDITGCTHLFGGEDALLNDLRTRLHAQGFAVKLAIADYAGAAWACARYRPNSIIKSAEHMDLLSQLPLNALRLEDNHISQLSKVGFKTIGCLMGLPRAPLASRFGTLLLQRLDQLLGHEDEVLSPLQPVAQLIREKRFFEPIAYEDDIKATIAHLAKELVLDLEKQGLGVRQCRLQLFRTDGGITCLDVRSTQPIRNAQTITRLFDERLASLHSDWDAGFGFDVIQLLAVHCDQFDATQHGLSKELAKHDERSEDVTHLIDKLSVRLGEQSVRVYQQADTHIPERSFGLTPAIHQPSTGAVAADNLHIPAIQTRPLILFEQPELTSVMAQIPEGPPLHFRWRKVHYEVKHFEGPERIACEWWKDGRAAKTRDYFRIETKEGLRMWLFRHGLYNRETNDPKWYMHGMFA